MAPLSLHLSKYHIVGNHMRWLNMKAPSVKQWKSVKYLIMAMETVADREPNK